MSFTIITAKEAERRSNVYRGSDESIGNLQKVMKEIERASGPLGAGKTEIEVHAVLVDQQTETILKSLGYEVGPEDGNIPMKRKISWENGKKKK